MANWMANSIYNKNLCSYISGRVRMARAERESSFPNWSGPEPKVRLHAEGQGTLCPRSYSMPKGQRKSEPSHEAEQEWMTSACTGKGSRDWSNNKPNNIYYVQGADDDRESRAYFIMKYYKHT